MKPKKKKQASFCIFQEQGGGSKFLLTTLRVVLLSEAHRLHTPHTHTHARQSHAHTHTKTSEDIVWLNELETQRYKDQICQKI